MVLARIYCILIGYGFGNFLTAYVVSYWKTRKSPRELGSGNPGTANIGAVLGKQFGLLVLLGDLLKTGAALAICAWLFPGLGVLALAYAGIGVTLGHNFPVWLHFRGGKGVAVSSLLVVAIDWRYGLLCLLFALVIMLITQNLTLPGIMILLSFTVVAAWRYTWELSACFAFLTLLSCFSFRHDLLALKRGQAKKVDWLKKFRRSKP